MNRSQRRAHNAAQRQHPEQLVSVPRDQWETYPTNLLEVWRNARYLVQVYSDGGNTRISVNRVTLQAGGWAEHIPFEDLMQIKAAVGYKYRQAIEIYPPESKLVNVANMRHLWVLPHDLAIGWN